MMVTRRSFSEASLPPKLMLPKASGLEAITTSFAGYPALISSLATACERCCANLAL